MSKKSSQIILTVNPATGKGDDLIATARAAVTHLHSLCEQDDCGRYTGRFAIQKTLEDAGFTTSVPYFILFLNFMGLVRKLNKDGSEQRGSQYRYLVLDPTFFDLLVTEESVCAVLKHMGERLELQRTCNALEKQLEKLKENAETSSTTNDDDIAKMNENLAEVIAEVERLKVENAEKDARISELEAELRANPKVNPKTVSEELMARFKQIKSA